MSIEYGEIFDFSEALIHCSCIYYVVAPGKEKTPKQKYEYTKILLEEEVQKYDDMGERKQGMTNGLKKAAKIAGLEFELSRLEPTKHIDPLPAGAKSYLKRIYGELKYGKRTAYKEKGNKYTNKGLLAEESSLKLISELDGVEYKKNDSRITNEFLTGIPDTFIGESIDKAEYVPDVKSSWDWDTFSDSLDKNLNPLYWWQIQGYLALTGASAGEVSYCLISMPESLLLDELRYLAERLQKKLDVIDVTITKEYKEGAISLVNNLTFDEIPPKERRQKFEVTRNEEAIQKIYEVVPKCREYLQELQEKHLMGVFSDKDLPMLEEIEEI